MHTFYPEGRMHILPLAIPAAGFLHWLAAGWCLSYAGMNRLRTGTLIALFAALAGDTSLLLAGEPQPVAFTSNYQGWKTLCLTNG